MPWRSWSSWRFILSRRLPRRKRCAPKAANAPCDREIPSLSTRPRGRRYDGTLVVVVVVVVRGAPAKVADVEPRAALHGRAPCMEACERSRTRTTTMDDPRARRRGLAPVRARERDPCGAAREGGG